MQRPNVSRRRFLKFAGLAGAAVTVPALIGGYGVWRAAEGEALPTVAPHLDRTAWRWSADAPTRPILLLTASQSRYPFGAYLAEILIAEGINCFHLATLGEVEDAALQRAPVIVLAESSLTQSEVERVAGYVARGGRLITLRPDVGLAAALGLERLTGVTTDQLVQLAGRERWAGAMTTSPVQFHGEADHYRAAADAVVAWLADASGVTDYAAIIWQRFGQGQVIAWAYDLAYSVALSRQGNPAWANQARASRDGNIRAQDMLYEWADLERIEVPQADEQMRLLSRLITELLADALPLPRLWYFPGSAPALLIATGDSHQNPASAIEDVLSRVEQRSGRMTIYYAPPSDGELRRAVRRARSLASDAPIVGEALNDYLPTPGIIAKWLARGHEFGLHPFVEEGLELGWSRFWQDFTGLGYGPVPPTVRTHRILWTGWAKTALIQASHRIRMNLDYYHYGSFLRRADGEWAFGHLTGSGLPMRFVDETGQVLNIYQQNTQLVDEQVMEMPWGGGWAGLDVEQALAVSRIVLKRATQPGGWAAVAAQFHIDPFAAGAEWAARFGRWLEGTLDSAVDYAIPIYSAEKWLTFCEAREAATFEWLTATEGQVRFQCNAPLAEGVELALMLPVRWGEKSLRELKVDGQSVAMASRTVAGIDYSWASVQAREHAVEANYA